MKKLLLILLGTLIVLPALAHDFEYTYEGQTLTYTVTDEDAMTCEVVKNSVSEYLAIPFRAKDGEKVYSVISIGESAFSDCSSLYSVEIPYSVTSIGNLAFANCNKLTSIYYGADVPIEGDNDIFSESTYENAYLYMNEAGASKAQTIAPWKNFSKIMIHSFATHDFTYEYEGQSLTYTVIDEVARTCKVVPPNYFVSGSLIIPSIVRDGDIEYSVISIGDNAFLYCQLTSVEIPNSVTSIGEYAFLGCYDLTSVEIPNSVTSIGNYAFRICNHLTSVELPNSVTSIGNWAFEGCENLNTVTIGNSVNSIGDFAFSSCCALTSVEIPNSVSSIGENAFNNCISLTTIEIPNSVSSIGKEAFIHCSGLTSIKLSNSVSSINDWTFANCTNLTSIEIPNSVTTIGEKAFTNCSNLTSIEIPNSVTTIGEEAFSYCTHLGFVSIGNSVTSIGGWAFRGCSRLVTVIIPASLSHTGHYPFTECSLSGVYYVSDDPIEFGESLFSSTEASLLDYGTLYMTETGKTKAQSISPWKEFKNIEVVSSPLHYLTYTNEGNTMHYIVNDENAKTCNLACGNMVSGNCVIPSIVKDSDTEYTVTSIGPGTFSDCLELTSVEIPNSITTIGNFAFLYCSNLTSVHTPNSITFIGECAFRDCNALTSVSISNSVNFIGSRAFFGCDNLASVYYGADDPIKCNPNIHRDIFSLSPQLEATLYMSKKGILKSRDFYPWNLFYNIEVYDFDGIEAIDADIDNDKPCEVYSVSGAKVGDTTESLAPGIYIVRQGNAVKKIAVKKN